MFYHAKVFTSTLTGTRLKQIVCEKCAVVFHYQLTRIGVGKASAPYGIGKQSAKKRAEKGARKNLDHRLECNVELVPCPECRFVNMALIQHYRKSRHRGFQWFAGTIVLFGVTLDIFLYGDAQDIFKKPITLWDPAIWIVALAAVAIAAVALLVQYFLRLRINPNKLVNGFPDVPPGTPPALTKQTLESGQQVFAPVPSEYSNLQTEAKWATFRPGQLVFEPLCCKCLDTATCTFKVPMTVAKIMPVPFCQPCLRHLRRQWFLRNLMMLPIALAIGWVASRLPAGIDDVGRIIMAVGLAFVAALIGFTVVDTGLHPYQLKAVDADRGIWKICFQNPAYTAILVRKFGEADGLYQSPL